jgi:oligopeptidase A
MSSPLLHLSSDIPWSAIRAADVVPSVRALVSDARAAIATIGASAPATYDGVLGALERATEPLGRAMSVISHLEGVAMTPELREAYGTVNPEVSAFYGAIPLDAALYAKLKALAESGEGKKLTGPHRRHLDKTVEEFRRHGAELDDGGKTRLTAIDTELATKTTSFSNHVLDATNAFELIIDDEQRLAGLPDSAKAMLRASAASKGKEGFRITLQAPSVIAVLTYVDDASIRQAVWTAYNQRASGGERDNAALIEDILKLRAEKAHLLGKKDFADLVLEDRMAKDGDRAEAFVRDLTERTEPAFVKEKAELLAFRRELEGADAADLSPWDVGYYAEKLRSTRYDFDEEILRPYFAADRAIEGLFRIAGRLYGVTFEERAVQAWDPAVRVFTVREGEQELGHFYVDLFPRETKRGGAWMASLLTAGVEPDGSRVPHVALFCANVSPPTDGKPALLTHDEVTTLFHEFGHLLHHMLSKVEVRALAGTNVAWDFVELPSQIHENWAWEREALDLFARHIETDATLPGELLEKMRRARTFRGATQQMRQLGFASLDLMLHRRFDPARDGAVLPWAREQMQRFSPAPLPESFGMLASFSHLFAGAVGYAAGYYSYKWAEVLDADAFSRFLERGIFDSETGRAFKDQILSRGDGEDPMKLFVDFMGREPELGPLLVRTGIPAGA